MIYIAIVLFALAAVLGLVILLKWLSKKDASKAVVYSHGVVAAIALVILIVFALQNASNFPKVSIALFVIGALVGFYMFINDLRQKMTPMAVAFLHTLIGVAGFVGLLLFAFA